jgi:nicotinate-nucleotide adenylyltransferase
MQVGVFGGSFDPIHNGHLQAAESCRQAAALDLVLFVPAAAQPLKPAGPVASAQDRLHMLGLALEGREEFAVSTIEVERGGVSYTVDTLREISATRTGDRLFLILGADALGDLAKWREPEEICRLATLLVVNRRGAALPGHPPGASVVRVEMELVDVSSSEIRDRLRHGAPIEALVPSAVAAYIKERGLYRDRHAAERP